MRFRVAALAAAATFAFSACHSEPTGPDGPMAASDAAATLLHLADSLSTHGGTPTEVAAYRGLASLLVGTGRISSVTISVDGQASEYLATAQEIQFGGCPPGMYCSTISAGLLPDRSFIAWQKSNPRRVVQLFAPGEHLYALDGGVTSSVMQRAPTVMFMDGSGALYGGFAASQSITVTTSATPCTPPDPNVAVLRTTFTCTQADFAVAFDASTHLIPLDGPGAPGPIVSTAATTNTTGAPGHHVTMASQTVRGAHVIMPLTCAPCGPAGPWTPPVATPGRDSLVATLTATIGSDVTFTFTVKNTTATSTTMQFNDGQQYDIRVWNDKDVLVWRWAADKAFPQVVGTRTLAPGESVSWVEHWARPAAGSYRALAYLTSSSHGASSYITFPVP